jgi:hypothetical protein
MHRFCSAATLALLLGTPLAAAKTEALSWGKPGVSIDQYRTDAISCGRMGYYADVSETEAARIFKNATGQLQANETDLANATGPRILDIVTRSAHIVDATNGPERIRDVGAQMQAQVGDCLRNRGYVRFRLTDAQRKRLGRLHLGSPERHAYLYRLATDPDILKAQAM